MSSIRDIKSAQKAAEYLFQKLLPETSISSIKTIQADFEGFRESWGSLRLFKGKLKILHEIVFDFRYKNDIHAIFKKHSAYSKKENIRPAIDEIYSNIYFKRVKAAYPDKETLINSLEKETNLNWAKALNVFLEQKGVNENVPISGAKNPVHYF